MEIADEGTTLSSAELEKEIGKACYIMYNNELSHSKPHKYTPPTYTLEELKEWMSDQPNVKELFTNWINSSNVDHGNNRTEMDGLNHL